ncbi:U7 snRNA-associated Sm-like protein LSm10, partial [Haematococcus lacustris]
MQEDDTLGGGGSGALVGDNPRRRRRTAQRRPGREERSLACLIQALEGRRVVVELRSDIIIRGLLDEADEFLNLSMTDATTQNVAVSSLC